MATSSGSDRFAQWWSQEDLRDLPLLLRLAHDAGDSHILSLLETQGHPKLPMTAWLALRHIGPRGRSAARLAVDLKVSRQAMSKVLSDMHRHELVKVEPHWQAGRLVQVTGRGEQARAAFEAAVDDVVADIGDAVPDDLLARIVLGLNLLAYHDDDEVWLRLLSFASSVGATAVDVSERSPGDGTALSRLRQPG